MQFIVFSLLSLAAAGGGNYGVEVGGYPTYWERTVGAFINAARIDPQAYTSVHGNDHTPSLNSVGVLTLQNFPPGSPVYYDPASASGARAHSADLANTPCTVRKDSCDNTPWATRLGSGYSNACLLPPAISAESVTGSAIDPRNAVNDQLCSNNACKTCGTCGQATACCQDGFTNCSCTNDDSRASVLNRSVTTGGVGFNSSFVGNFTTEDFFAPGCNLPQTPIFSGSHANQYPSAGRTYFFAQYNDTSGVDPNVAEINIDGVCIPLNKEYGRPGRGNFNTSTPAAGSCRSFYFHFQTNLGVDWTYPEIGALRTFQEGSCNETYNTTRPPPCPTQAPSNAPSPRPTVSLAPTGVPTGGSLAPTRVPTGSLAPTAVPTGGGSLAPTAVPTGGGSLAPTAVPTGGGSLAPTRVPTGSLAPTAVPTGGGSLAPTRVPTGGGSLAPTAVPTGGSGTNAPTAVPTGGSGTNAPTAVPTGGSSSAAPTAVPTGGSSSAPTRAPTGGSTTVKPTSAPTGGSTTTVTPTARPSNSTQAPATQAVCDLFTLGLEVCRSCLCSCGLNSTVPVPDATPQKPACSSPKCEDPNCKRAAQAFAKCVNQLNLQVSDDFYQKIINLFGGCGALSAASGTAVSAVALVASGLFVILV